MNLDNNLPERTAFYRSKVVKIQSDCTNQSISDEQIQNETDNCSNRHAK